MRDESRPYGVFGVLDSYLRCVNMSGVTWPTMKLFIQLDEAPKATKRVS